MKERPILFQGEMVRALLAGRKTQTRRAVKHAEHIEQFERNADGSFYYDYLDELDPAYVRSRKVPCPYGQPGDRLWVRESWMPDPPNDGTWGYTAWAGVAIGQIAGVPERFRHPAFCNYAASWLHGPVKWTPSIHMPRWASRILLEVTGVRVERLWDISDDDVRAEGCEGTKLSYAKLWESINGRGSWDANPWVWVVEFRRAA